VCHARLTEHTGLASGLRFSVADSTGSDVQLLSPARTPVPLPARLGDRQVSGKKKECAAINQRLLNQMKVAVSAATGEGAYSTVANTLGPPRDYDSR
jgi:hypothetical protein